MVKFGVYDDDRPVFDWLRHGVEGRGRCLEAQVMDLADDVAYSVHDVEDGIVAGRLDLTRLDRDALWATVRSWYLQGIDDAALDRALADLRAIGSWPRSSYDGSRRSLAAIKNLTSDLIGRFCGSVQEPTFAAAGGEPLVRHRADLVVPADTEVEIGVLKGIAAHYVMQADDRVSLMSASAHWSPSSSRRCGTAAPTPSTRSSCTTGTTPRTTQDGAAWSSTRWPR